MSSQEHDRLDSPGRSQTDGQQQCGGDAADNNRLSSEELLVITDLHGTLIDRKGSAEAAEPALRRLQEQGIPVVFNSSKPEKDILLLQEKLGLNAPLISESGSALVFGQYSGHFSGADRIAFARSREQILHILSAISEHEEYSYLAFSALSDKQIKQYCGISTGKTAWLQAKTYTETLLWRDTEAALAEFRDKLEAYDLACLGSDQLVKVRSRVNKALPVRTLLDWYQEQGRKVRRVLALGDGKNDVPLLQAADDGFLLGGGKQLADTPDNAHIHQVSDKGPEAWNRVVMQWLDKHAVP